MENKDTLNLISSHFAMIQKLKGEIQVLKDQLDDVLSTNKDYQDAEKEAEVVKETKQLARQKAEEVPAVVTVNEELKDKKTELKDLRDALSAELVEFYKDTGQSEITLGAKTYKFSFSVRLS